MVVNLEAFLRCESPSHHRKVVKLTFVVQTPGRGEPELPGIVIGHDVLGENRAADSKLTV